MKGVSANVMCGQEGYFGTSAFDVILDMDYINNKEDIDKLLNDVKILENSYKNEKNEKNNI